MITFVPMFWQDFYSPGLAANKITALHWFQEKQIDAKLRLALDDCVTEWDDNLNNNGIESAISRTFL